jgi:FtsH-binding integral membrane protein
MLIFAGFRFITANGDANSISAARNMIIYAVIGLVIAVLAQFIVHSVVNTANTVQQNSYLNGYSSVKRDA